VQDIHASPKSLGAVWPTHTLETVPPGFPSGQGSHTGSGIQIQHDRDKRDKEESGRGGALVVEREKE